MAQLCRHHRGGRLSPRGAEIQQGTWMNKLLAAPALLVLSGCASVLNESTHPIRIETLTPQGELVSGSDCSITNDKGKFTVRSGDTVNVRRSSKDLDITCNSPGQPTATARAVSRANGGMWGNILLGGAVGAIVDHNKGTAYTYPTWIQLVFGKVLTFDRRGEKDGTPVHGVEISTHADVAASQP